MSGRHIAAEEPSDDPTVSITVLRGDPSAEELAAVTAVLAAMAQEAADDAQLASGSGSGSGPAENAWQGSSRGIRAALHPGAGKWRGFL